MAKPKPAAQPAQPADTADTADTPAVVALLVTARRDGFRRAGRAWGRTATRVEAGELTHQQIRDLYLEPLLDVVGVAE